MQIGGILFMLSFWTTDMHNKIAKWGCSLNNTRLLGAINRVHIYWRAYDIYLRIFWCVQIFPINHSVIGDDVGQHSSTWSRGVRPVSVWRKSQSTQQKNADSLDTVQEGELAGNIIACSFENNSW